MAPLSPADLQKALGLTKEGRVKDALEALKGLLPTQPVAAGANVARGVMDKLAALVPSVNLTGAGLPGSGLPGAGLSGAGLTGLGARTAARGGAPDARTRQLSFTNAAGTRAYALYVPTALDNSRPPALVVMLHGCTQSPEDFAAGTRMNELAEEHGFLVAYPAQAMAANAGRCWNWFADNEQRRDEGEPSLIAGITRAVIRDFGVDPGRVYVAGLSAGGAEAALLGRLYPDLYAAVGVHSGLSCGAARDMPSAYTAMRQGAPGAPPNTVTVPTIVFHGDRDSTVAPVNGDYVVAQATGPAPLTRRDTEGRSPGGVAYTRSEHLDAQGRSRLEQWTLHGAGHAWSGGSVDGSYTDPRGPDASREMVRFFLAQPPVLH